MPTRNLIESFHVQSIFVKIATITLSSLSFNPSLWNYYIVDSNCAVVLLRILNIKWNWVCIMAENVIKDNSFSFRHVAGLECDAITRMKYKLMVH